MAGEAILCSEHYPHALIKELNDTINRNCYTFIAYSHYETSSVYFSTNEDKNSVMITGKGQFIAQSCSFFSKI